MSTFISTSCINGDLPTVLNVYDRLGIKNIELGVYNYYINDLKAILEKYNFNYIVHHYFPPPQKQFIINLASSDEKILNRSLNQILNSIDFCEKFNINFLSIHSGFRVDPDINLKFNTKKIPKYENSFNIFVDSVKKIVDHAENSNVKIAVENNVIARHNLIDGENKLLLMCEANEFENLFKEVRSENLGILLDLGHLKVNANILKFDMNTFVNRTKKYVSAVHIHENNGFIDEHNCIKNGDDILELFFEYFKAVDIPSVLECKFRNEKEINNTLNLLEKGTISGI